MFMWAKLSYLYRKLDKQITLMSFCSKALLQDISSSLSNWSTQTLSKIFVSSTQTCSQRDRVWIWQQPLSILLRALNSRFKTSIVHLLMSSQLKKWWVAMMSSLCASPQSSADFQQTWVNSSGDQTSHPTWAPQTAAAKCSTLSRKLENLSPTRKSVNSRSSTQRQELNFSHTRLALNKRV